MISKEQIEENLKRGWAIVDGFPFHRVTLDGQVLTCKRRGAPKKSFSWTLMRVSNGNHGYKVVSLSGPGGRKSFLVHRLVCSAFIPNTQSDPQVNHIDGNKMNNHFSNLEWASAYKNINHALATGLSKKVKNSKINEEAAAVIRERLRMGVKQKDIAASFNISISTVSRVKLNQSWKDVA